MRHWRRDVRDGPVLIPELAVRPRALYSFRDVLALRTCVRLRQDASLQKIRRAIGNLRRLGEIEHLSSYSLVADGDSIALVGNDSEHSTDLVKRPGQQVVATLAEILEPFSVRPGVVVPHLLRPTAHITLDPETQGGSPVITGTRVPYDAVVELLEDGVRAEKIADYYPAVTPEAARDAQTFALYVNSYQPEPRAS
nr:DUF433 domain-containing protein [Streptomyces aidingensis]